MDFDSVLFDFDGVLADSETLHYQGFLEIAQRTWNQGFDREMYDRELIGFDDREGFRYLADKFGVSLTDEQVQQLEESKEEFLADKIAVAPLMEGAQDLYSFVRKQYPFGIVSGALRSEILSIMNHHDLPVPEVLVAANDTELGKPNPDPYARGIVLLQEKLGHKAQRTLVFEDTATGVESALAAGCYVVQLSSDPVADERVLPVSAWDSTLWDRIAEWQL